MSDGDGAAVLAGLGARFDHSAHAVPSVASALPLYVDILGGEVLSAGISPWGGHLAVQIGYPGGGKVELLEPTRPDSPSVGAFLRANPRGGLHHLTFKVDDLAEAIAALEAAGYRLVGTFTDHDEWRETFLHPRETGGALIQLAQAAPGVPGPLDRPLQEILDDARALRDAAGASGASPTKGPSDGDRPH